MKRSLILLGFALAAIIIVLSSIINPARSNRNGAEAGVSGSTYDGTTCINCHSPSHNFTGAGSISTNIPAAGYTAGQTYTITTSITRAGHSVMGFELSPTDTTGNYLLGTLVITNPSTTQLASGQQGWVTHTMAGTNATGGSISWSFNWTAPATGKGPVIFYADFNASNDNGHDNGDSIFITSLKIYEDICTQPSAPGTVSGSTSVCPNTSTTYSVSAVSGATSYIWTLPSGWTGTSTTNSITVTTGSAGGAVSVKASNACGTSSASTINVTVTNAGTASVSIAASHSSICSGSIDTFTATPTNGGASPTYQWKVNGTNQGTSSPIFTSSSLVSGSVVNCVMTSDLTCVAGSPATSNSITVTVNQPVSPSISIVSTASGDSACQGSNVTFNTGTPVNGGPSPTYQWFKNDSSIGGATASSYSSTALVTGDVITVKMTSNAACASPVTVSSNAITTTIDQPVAPAITIVSSAAGDSACQGTNVTFGIGTKTNSGASPSYQWFNNGVVIGGATSASYSSSSLANGDVITVRMTSDVACVSPVTVTSNPITTTIAQPATPSISIISDAGGDSICSGGNVTFSITTPINGGTSPTYQWFKNGNSISGATSTSYSTTSLVDGDVITVKMTSDAACVSPTTVTSNAISTRVLPLVTPSVTILSNSGSSICAGQNVTFQSTVQNGGTSPVYQWIKNGVNIQDATSAAYFTDTLVNGDNISLRITSDASCLGTSTTTSNVIQISIVTNATPIITITSTLGDTICAGAAPLFIATPTNGGDQPALQWYRDGFAVGDTMLTYSPGYIALTTGSVIQATMVSNSQCVVTDSATSNQITMYVTPSSLDSVTIAASAGSSICQGQSVTFTASAVNAGTSPLYQWQKNGANISGATLYSYTTNMLVDSDVIDVILTPAVACGSPATATSNTIQMSIATNATPTISITSTLGDTICSGDAPLFIATQTNGGSQPALQWYRDGSAVGDTSLTYSPGYVPLTTGSVIQATMISNSQCVVTDSAASNQITMYIIPTSFDSVTVASNPGTSICAGQQVKFSANSTSPGTNPLYQWQKNGINILNANSATYITDSLANGDSILCFVTSSLGCVTPRTAVSDTLTITVNPLPVPVVQLENDSLVTGAEASYQWYLNDSVIAGANSQTLKPVVLGNYAVMVTDSNGCQGTSRAFDVTALGIAELSQLFSISIYPNPADGLLNIDYSLAEVTNVEVRLYDVNGRLLLTGKDGQSTGGKTILNVSGFQSGLYILELNDGKNTDYRKIIISR